MSRKSAAALSVIAVMPGQRYDAPTCLTKAEAIVWRSVASTKPADWFSPDTHPLLIQLCRHVVKSHEIAELLKGLSPAPGDKDALKEYISLINLQGVQTGNIVRLSTSMRITQQSQATQTAAKTATVTENAASSGKPWAQQA